MIWMFFLLLNYMLLGSHFEITLVEDKKDSPKDVFVDFALIGQGQNMDKASEEDIAETIMNGFLTQSNHKLSPYIKTILVERIKREQEEVKITLARVAHAHTPISQSQDPVSVKVAEIFTEAMEEALDMHEQKSQEAQREIDSRCKRTTTIILVGGLTLIGTALGALVSALITNAVTN